jgi:hypothetical protein
MATGVASSDAITISRRKVERDLSVSLTLAACGAVIWVAWFLLAVAGRLFVNSASFASLSVLGLVIPGTASVFLLIGTIFAVINWSMLRSRFPAR